MTLSVPSSARLAEHDLAVHGHSTLTAAQCQQLIARFGEQSSSYFNLQAGVERFGLQDLGFIAYYPLKTLAGRVNMVFANPVCSASTRKMLLRAFLKQVEGRALFMGIDAETAEDLRSLGYKANEMGTEFAIPLKSFSTEGKKMKQLRHAANLGKRCGVSVKEQNWGEIDANRVREISEGWRNHKAVKNHELRLLTRPPVYANEWGVRKFYGYQNGEMLGFVFFDPYYRHGKVVGYTANILRQDFDKAPTGLLDHIILQAAETFRAEGIELLSLGISPVYNVQKIAGDRPLIRQVCQMLYKYGNSFYSFQALAYHKTRYRGEETKWYMASDDMHSLRVAWSILRGTGVLGNPDRSAQKGGAILAGLL